jgi:hypothetical protein
VLDISPYAFVPVVETLERAGMVDEVHRRGQKIVSFTENDPFCQSLYDRLGESWRGEEPSQIEQGMLAVLDRLATSPVPAEELETELGLDRGDIPRLLKVGSASELIKGVTLIEGEVLYSQFFGLENPSCSHRCWTRTARAGSPRTSPPCALIRDCHTMTLPTRHWPTPSAAAPSSRPRSSCPTGREQPFDQVHNVNGSPLLRRDSDKNNGPLARLRVARCRR